MKEILLTQSRTFIKLLVAFTAIIVISLVQAGQLYLIGGVVAGYLTGLAWYGLMLGRLMRSSGMTVEQAKRQMVVGMVLRILILAAVLAGAIQISFDMFIVVFGSCALVYLLVFVLLLVTSYND